MDFDGYSQWAEGRLGEVSDATFSAVQEYWDNDIKHEQELTQTIGGM